MYARFAPVEAGIAETCLVKLRESPLVVEFDETPSQRVVTEVCRSL
jgi:hypothetical protein